MGRLFLSRLLFPKSQRVQHSHNFRDDREAVLCRSFQTAELLPLRSNDLPHHDLRIGYTQNAQNILSRVGRRPALSRRSTDQKLQAPYWQMQRSGRSGHVPTHEPQNERPPRKQETSRRFWRATTTPKVGPMRPTQNYWPSFPKAPWASLWSQQ